MKKENNSSCTQAQSCYYDYLSGQSSAATDMEFEHIRQCPHCLGQIETLKQQTEGKAGSTDICDRMLAMHHRFLSAWIDCDVVKPFLASQVHPQLSIRTQTPVTEHIARCQTCSHDLQTLLGLGMSEPQLGEAAHILADEACGTNLLDEKMRHVITGIRNRKPSGIITRMHTDLQGQPTVQVRHTQASLTRRHVLIRFTAAAGILLVASLVVMMTTVAGGVSLQDVYSAIHAIENCRIEIRDAEADVPGQNIILSRALNLIVSQRKNETVILDFRNKKLHKSTPETSIVTESSDSQLASVINRPDFGLLPFDSITKIPSNYQWKYLESSDRYGQYEIYELIWIKNTAVAGPIEMTWRGYLLKDSHLPERIEWFEKRPGQSQELLTETTIRYPDTSAVLKELQSVPLYQLLEGDQIK